MLLRVDWYKFISFTSVIFFYRMYVTQISITGNVCVLKFLYTYLPLPLAIFAHFISTRYSVQGRHLHLKLP